MIARKVRCGVVRKAICSDVCEVMGRAARGGGWVGKVGRQTCGQFLPCANARRTLRVLCVLCPVSSFAIAFHESRFAVQHEAFREYLAAIMLQPQLFVEDAETEYRDTLRFLHASLSMQTSSMVARPLRFEISSERRTPASSRGFLVLRSARAALL